MKLSRKLTIATCFCAFISLATPQVPQAFDVSSVKENKSGSEAFSIPTNTHGTFVGKNMTLMLLITTAYRVQNVQVIGGPSWIKTARFDIDAKGPDTAATAPEVYAVAHEVNGS